MKYTDEQLKKMGISRRKSISKDIDYCLYDTKSISEFIRYIIDLSDNLIDPKLYLDYSGGGGYDPERTILTVYGEQEKTDHEIQLEVDYLEGLKNKQQHDLEVQKENELKTLKRLAKKYNKKLTDK